MMIMIKIHQIFCLLKRLPQYFCLNHFRYKLRSIFCSEIGLETNPEGRILDVDTISGAGAT